VEEGAKTTQLLNFTCHPVPSFEIGNNTEVAEIHLNFSFTQSWKPCHVESYVCSIYGTQWVLSRMDAVKDDTC